MKELLRILSLALFIALAAGWCCLVDGVAWAQTGERRRRRGLASWYGDAYRGSAMANGARFDPEAMTAASWDYPLNSRVRVTCVATGEAMWVRVTDRGPGGVARSRGRIIDLSRAAFARLGDLKHGTIEVDVELDTEKSK